jgi:hypothetical protein
MGDPDVDEPSLVARFYTAGRRHPIMIGNLNGLRIPPMTPAQIGVFLGALGVLLFTQGLWAHLGTFLNGLVLLGLPATLAWAARAVRMEGRAPWRAGMGWLQLLAAPRHGTRVGRLERPARPGHWSGRAWVAELVPVESPSSRGNG